MAKQYQVKNIAGEVFQTTPFEEDEGKVIDAFRQAYGHIPGFKLVVEEGIVVGKEIKFVDFVP